MSRRAQWLCLPLLLLSCRELSVPPPPGPGFMTGRVVVAEPGTGRKRPAPDVLLELNLTNLRTRTNAEGRFTLGPLPRREGSLSLRLDADGDGRFERQRVINLAALALPPSGDVAVGDLELTENALIRGRVLRADVPASAGGHGGTTVFIPQSPYTTTTADNGDFILRDLPDGEHQLSAWRAGYEPGGFSGVDLTPGQLLELSPITLAVKPAGGPASLRGTVLRAGQASHGGLEVRLVSLRSTPGDVGAVVARATTADDGSYAMPNLVGGLYDLEVANTFTRLYNVFLPDGAETVAPELVVAEGQVAGPPAGPVQPPVELDGGPGVVDSGVPDAGVNLPPTVVVADVRTVTGGFVTLDARGSSDPEGEALRFIWVQQSGPTVLLTLSDSPVGATSFTAPSTPGLLEFLLRVSDPKGAFVERTVRVTVNAPPVAVTARSLVVLPGMQGTLDGTGSYDPDRTGALSYRWALVPEADGGVPNVTLSSLTVAQPTFTAPAAGTVFRVNLVVNDGEVDSAPAQTLVFSSSANVPPVAVPGPDLEADWGDALVLDGRGSYDPNGGALTYAWRFVSGSTACGTLADAGTPGTAVYTAPLGNCEAAVRLTVTDSASTSGAADLAVRVTDRRAPVVTGIGPSSPLASMAPVRFTFARLIDGNALPSLDVTQGDGGLVPGTVSYDASTRSLSFAPRAPWPVGEPLTATMGPARSTAGVAMDGGATYTFTASVPAITPEVSRVSNASLGQPYSNVMLAVGPSQSWLAYKPTGNFPNVRRQVVNVTAEQEGQITALGEPSESARLKVEPLSVVANGFAYFSNMVSTEANCGSFSGADFVLYRATGTLTSAFFSGVNLTPSATPLPSGYCMSVKSVSTALDRDQAVLAAWTMESAGVADVKVSRCTRCVDPVAASLTAADWVALPSPHTSMTETLRSVSIDARGQPPVVVWVSQTGTGRRVLRGRVYDWMTSTWTPLTRDGSDNLNGSVGDASAPVVRWRGGEPMIVWLHFENAVAELRVIQRRGSTWVPLGGRLNGDPPLIERPRVELVNDTPFVAWTEPVGDGKPHVAWYDERTDTWRNPQGTGMNGEIVVPASCTGTAPSISALPDRRGVALAYPVTCSSPAGSSILQREVR